jgi:hypothetical protein
MGPGYVMGPGRGDDLGMRLAVRARTLDSKLGREARRATLMRKRE